MSEERKQSLLARYVSVLERKAGYDEEIKEDMKSLNEETKGEFGDHKPFIQAAKVIITDRDKLDKMEDLQREVRDLVDSYKG